MSCGDSGTLWFPGACWPTHLNFILPSTAWLPTAADVILGTRGRVPRSGTSPRPHRSPPGEARTGSPFGRSLSVCSLTPQCLRMATGRRHCPCWAGPGLCKARPSTSSPGGRPQGAGLRARSPSRTWLTFWSRRQSWLGSNSGPAGKPPPGSEGKETWPDLDPTPGRTLSSRAPVPGAAEA